VRRPRADIARIAAQLLGWFAANARDLPWRRTHDAYAIWVSEIMLQQTQVKTVIPFWQRWMQKLPTVQSLARARVQTLYKLWEGLGYYRRVRNMQKAARLILREHSGEFPSDYDQVLALPGIGRYTAGAICSIAFNQPKPILDGNVTRVLTRLFGIRGDPKEKAINALLWENAQVLVQAAAIPPAQSRSARCARSCSLLNQALMELGALVCTPKQPKCGSCPVRRYCVAARHRLTELLPQLKSRPASTRRSFIAFVLSHQDRFLVRQRPPNVVNGDLWEFPNVEQNGAATNWPRAQCRRLGGDPASLRPLCHIEHSITRFRISLQALRGETGQPPRPRPQTEGQWLKLSHLDRLPFSSAHKQILNALRAHGND
jgi:A/G-specific adenine glycosylase